MCARWGIPHSRFLRWSRLDRDKAIWHEIRKRQTCNNCGTHPDEWDESKGGDRFAYVALEQRCRGCQVRDSARDRLAGRDDHGHGIYVVLERNQPLPEVVSDGERGEPGPGLQHDHQPGWGEAGRIAG